MTPKNYLCSVFLTTLAFSQGVFADGIIERGEWTLWEEQTPSGTICYMQAVDSQVFRKEDFLIEIYHAKNNYDSPIEVITKINKNKNNNTALRFDLKAGSQLGFADISGTREKFWAVPKNLSSLIAQLQSGEDLNGKAFGGGKEIDVQFGADGFAEVYAAFEKHCNNGYALVEDRFEKEFLSVMPNSVDAPRLAVDKVNALRAAYIAAFALHRQNLGVEAQLAAVLAKYQTYIDEQKSNRDEKHQIQTIHLPQSQKTLADSQKAQVDLRAEIERLTAQIPALREQVLKSTQILESARAVLAPLLPEFNRLNSLVRTNEDALRTAQNRLSFIDSRLNELSRSIASLQSEVDHVERHLRQLRIDYDRAIVHLRDAEFRRSQFDVRREIDRRLRENGEYSRIKAERDSIDPQMSQIQMLLTQVEQERVRIVRDLEACRAEAGKDCSEIEQGLAQADRLISEKRAELNQLDDRKREIDRAISNLENQVTNEVRREYDMLVDRENRSRQDVNHLDESIRNDQNRLNSIRNVELPRMQDEQRSLSNERPLVQSQIADRDRQLRQVQHDLERFRSINDYDRKANDVARKESQLSQDQASLDQVLRAKASNEQRLQEAISTEARMKQRIKELTARVVTLDARNVDLEKALKNLPAERAPVDVKLAQLKKAMNSKKEEMLKLIKG